MWRCLCEALIQFVDAAFFFLSSTLSILIMDTLHSEKQKQQEPICWNRKQTVGGNEVGYYFFYIHTSMVYCFNQSKSHLNKFRFDLMRAH